MTSLQSYLTSVAVEDVRKLLKQKPWTDEGDRSWSATLIDDGIAWDEMVNPGIVWREVVLCFADELSLTCYYRESSLGQHIVSDCGETVCEVMRRTGKDGLDAAKYADQSEEVAVVFGEMRLDATDLPAAIVAVLSAVAKVRAGLDKEPGQLEP